MGLIEEIIGKFFCRVAAYLNETLKRIAQKSGSRLASPAAVMNFK